MRSPLPLGLDDLLSADRVVALKRDEHLRIITRKFAQWASRIGYWHVDDLGLATPDEALRKIEGNVIALIKCLSVKGES